MIETYSGRLPDCQHSFVRCGNMDICTICQGIKNRWPLLCPESEPNTNKNKTNPKDLLGTDKVPLSRIPPVSIFHEGMAMGNGGDKYGPYNWRGNAVQADIYIDATLRHILSWFDGEEVAEDSGVHHLGHAKACLGIILDAQHTGNLVDNRPTGGKAAEVLDKLNKVRKEYRNKK